MVVVSRILLYLRSSDEHIIGFWPAKDEFPYALPSFFMPVHPRQDEGFVKMSTLIFRVIKQTCLKHFKG